MKTFWQIVLGLVACSVIFTGILGLSIDHTSDGRGAALFLLASGILCVVGIILIGRKKKRQRAAHTNKVPKAVAAEQGTETALVKRGSSVNLNVDGVELPLIEITSRRIDPDEDKPTPPDAELTYLDAEALKFWSGKHTDFEVPTYYSDTAFGRNVGPARERLLAGGYLDIGGIEKSISLKKVPELKAILAEKELKQSGKKAELVQRLLDNVEPDELEALFPIGVYEITEKGKRALEPYSIIDANNSHGLRFSYYRLISERTSHPEEPDLEILSRLLSDDINESIIKGDKSRYQDSMLLKGRFLHETGEDAAAFEYYILSYFMWAIDARTLGLTDHPQCYYQAKHIEECGMLCGYSIRDVCDRMRNIITEVNPFGLATGYNVKFVLKLFWDSLGMKNQ